MTGRRESAIDTLTDTNASAGVAGRAAGFRSGAALRSGSTDDRGGLRPAIVFGGKVLMPDYIRWLRQRVGHDEVFLNFAAACVVHDDRVLLQRRGDDGSWGLPGGALELGESAAEAVAREVAEETGVQIRIEDLLGVYTKYQHRYPNGDIAQTITTVFRCSPTGSTGSGTDEETLDVRYFPLAEVPSLMNRQHDDAISDLRANRSGVYR